jgi:hypothetical protein
VLQRFGWHLEATSRGVFLCAWLVYLPSLLRGDPRATPWRCATLLALMLFYLPLFCSTRAYGACPRRSSAAT